MSTDLRLQIDTADSEATEQLGKDFGARLKGGEIITLKSDLGGGKTTFVRGLVAGSGSVDQVTSPSFTVSNEYKAPKFLVYHYDLYRIEELGLLKDDILEKQKNNNVIVIEWSDLANSIIDHTRLVKIEILVTDLDQRFFEIEMPPSLQYLLGKE